MKRFACVFLLLLGLAVAAQGPRDEVVPGDNLVVEGIPKIPASLAASVARYTEFRSASLSSWHPTRREILVTTRFADANQIHHVKMPGGARTQLTFFPDRVAGGSYHPKHGSFFVFSKDVGGGEWFQLYRYDIATGDVTLLTDGKSRNSRGPWTNSGELIAYTSTRRTGRDSDIYLVNPADPKSDRLLAERPSGGWFPVDWSPDDKKLLVAEAISANESYLWLLDIASKEWSLLTPKGGAEKVAYTGAAFAPDGRGIYVATDKDSEFQRLALLDIATGAHTYLTSHIPWDVDAFELSHDGSTIAMVTNEDGAGILRLLDTRTRKEKTQPKLPVGQVGSLEWHANNRDLGLVIVGARSTADVYSLDVTTGRLDRWTFSETGGLNLDSFSEPQLVRWKSFDGKTISGFLYRPPAKFTGKRPVIISIHGGPEGQARPGFQGRNNFYLNELGVAVLYPNVRGSSGYGKTFLKLDNGFLREDSYKDINALFDWIAQQPDLDSERIMVTGGSYGGHMTLAIATYYPDRIRCTLSVVGIGNLRTFLENTEAYRRDLRRVEYGDERDSKMREFMERIAPANNAHKISKPLFVVQGGNDPRVPLSEAQQMVATMRQHNRPVWYLMAKDEGHGFAKRRNQDIQFYATVLFIQEHLLK